MRTPNDTPTSTTTAAPSHRLAALPTYVFAWLDELKEAARLSAKAGTDPRSAYLQVYDWLTFLQETLVRSLR